MHVVFTIRLPKTVKPKTRAVSMPRDAFEDDEVFVIPFQHIYGTVEVENLKELLKTLHEQDFIVAREFNVKTKYDGTKFFEERGEVIINCQLIGKIKPYYE